MYTKSTLYFKIPFPLAWIEFVHCQLFAFTMDRYFFQVRRIQRWSGDWGGPNLLDESAESHLAVLSDFTRSNESARNQNSYEQS